MAIQPIPRPGSTPSIRGGQALPVTVKPKKPKKPKLTKAKPAASYFPSADVSAADMARIMAQSRSSVAKDYAATPMPSLATYQQPFIDAAAREQKLGNDMLAAIGGAAQYSQGLTGGLSDWIQQNVGQAQQQAQQASAPGATQVPSYTTAAQTAVPIQSYGTSQTQYLNSLAPYVAGSAQQYQQDITKAQQGALRDYQSAQSTRQNEQAQAVQDLYGENLKSVTTSRENITKNAVAEYIALTSAGMKAKDAAEKVRVDTAKILADTRKLEQGDTALTISQQNANTSSYKATHPTTAATKPMTRAQLAQAKKDAIGAYQKQLGTATPLKTFSRTVKITYTQKPANGYGPDTKKQTTATFNDLPTQDANAAEVTAAFNAWKRKFGSQFPNASLTDKGVPKGVNVEGATVKNYPGLGTNWQNAVTAYAAYFQPKAGETSAQFRKRMAAAVEKFLPRPKAKKS